MNHKIFNRGLFCLFILFLALYFSGNVGLIDYEAKKKHELTEQEILKFEEDIRNGVKIDIDDYNKKDIKYDNMLSRNTLKVSSGISMFVKKIFNYLFSRMENTVNEDN